MIPIKQPIPMGGGGNTNQPVQKQETFIRQPATVLAIPGKPNHYFVEEGVGAYKVFWDGEKGTCACVEFQKTGRCTHIARAKEGPASVRTEAETERILKLPFPEKAIKTSPDGFKNIEISEIYKRLNEAFGVGNWSFELLKEPTEYDTEMVCNGSLTVYYYDRTGQRVCVCKEHTGACEFANDVGNDEFERFLTYGQARTGAIHMALRKCALMLGIGLGQQYDGETALNPREQAHDQNFKQEDVLRLQDDTGFSRQPVPF